MLMDQPSGNEYMLAFGMKRKRLHADISENRNGDTVRGRRVISGATFVTILGGPDFYQTEQWKSEDASLYVPMLNDVMLNLSCYEQVTFRAGSFFVSDLLGNYESTRQGMAVHLWKYDAVAKKLSISKSLLVTSTALYEELRGAMLLY